MTDREKLQLINAISMLVEENNYQPTSRPCFDKPASVPILHGETLESEARQEFMARRADVDRQCNMLLNEGWVSTSVKIGETL